MHLQIHMQINTFANTYLHDTRANVHTYCNCWLFTGHTWPASIQHQLTIFWLRRPHWFQRSPVLPSILPETVQDFANGNDLSMVCALPPISVKMLLLNKRPAKIWLLILSDCCALNSKWFMNPFSVYTLRWELAKKHEPIHMLIQMASYCAGATGRIITTWGQQMWDMMWRTAPNGWYVCAPKIFSCQLVQGTDMDRYAIRWGA